MLDTIRATSVLCVQQDKGASQLPTSKMNRSPDHADISNASTARLLA
jgi:hypothetical protein